MIQLSYIKYKCTVCEWIPIQRIRPDIIAENESNPPLLLNNLLRRKSFHEAIGLVSESNPEAILYYRYD